MYHADRSERGDSGPPERIAEDSAPTRLGSRSFTERIGGTPNCHQRWYAVRDFQDGRLLGVLRIARNYIVIELCKHMPSLGLKRQLFRTLLGMKLGRNVTISPGVTLDYFFPELIEMGDNTIVGLNATVISHEFLHDRVRIGKVSIGAGTMLGSHSQVLAGVAIGEGARISAMSFVNRSVPDHATVRGNPAQIVSIRR